MKKLTIAALFALLSAPLFSQQGLQIGFRLNPEFTGLTNNDDSDAGPELDFKKHFTYLSFGLGAVYNFNEHVGLGVDLLFSREGQAFTGTFNGGEIDSNAYSSVVATQMYLNDTFPYGKYEALAELNYIKLPIMLSLTSDNSKPAFFTMLVGPQINFLQGVAQEVNGEDLEYPDTDFEPKDLYKKLTFGGVLALGGGFNISSHMVLSARLRFDYGFNDVEKKDVMVSYYNDTPVRFYSAARRATHSATAGLMIGLDFKL